jgi:hypothetical protein
MMFLQKCLCRGQDSEQGQSTGGASASIYYILEIAYKVMSDITSVIAVRRIVYMRLCIKARSHTSGECRGMIAACDLALYLCEYFFGHNVRRPVFQI